MRSNHWLFSCSAAAMLVASGAPALAQSQSTPAPEVTGPTPPTATSADNPAPGQTGGAAAQGSNAPGIGNDTAAQALNNGNGLGDIVVTARRRSESLQKVPVAITAFSNEKLREQAISSAQDLNKAVPGLTVSSSSGSPGLPTFAIRGRGTNYGAAAGSVETYFAEVPLSGPFQAPTLGLQFFDVQSFQVLKGPQGTLFGRSTTGGAVLIVPQAPTDEFGGYARLQGGTYGDFQAEAAVNLPIVDDKVLLRVAGFEWRRQGYDRTYAGDTETLTGLPLGRQRYNSQNQTQLRATLLVKPTDNFSNSTLLTYTRDNGQYSAGAGLLLAGVDPATGDITTVGAPGYGTSHSHSDVRFNNPPRSAIAVINTTTLNINDDTTLKNIFGFISAKGSGSSGTNADGTTEIALSLPTFPRPPHNHQYTNEVQLQGHLMDDKLTYIVGGLLDREREPRGDNNIPLTVASILAPGFISSNFSSQNIDSYGAYGSLTYKLTSKLSVSAGYRHAWDKVSEKTGTTGLEGTTVPSTCCNANLRFLSRKFQGNIYNADVNYNASNSLLVYGGYRRGYKRGGFSDQSLNPATANFDPELVDDFYAGIKSRFDVGGVPIRFNIEGYYDNYKGQQVSYLDLNDNGSFATIITNVKATTYRGFEFDFTAEPTHWLTVEGNYSFIDAFNRKFIDPTTPAGVTQDLSGNPIPFVSKNKFQLTGRLHTEVSGDKGELVLAPTVNYQSRFITYPTATLLPYAQQLLEGAIFTGVPGTLLNINGLSGGADLVRGYTTVDLRLEWNHFLGSRFDLAANATNLTNKRYLTGNSATITFGIQGDAYGPPRMFTFEVSTKF